MQTFLPYPDLSLSIRCLDVKRLGKQRVEARQIYDSILNGSGWRNHPATVMWENNLEALAIYHNLAIHHWIERGYNNSMNLIRVPNSATVRMPSWLGRNDVHASHRARLLDKDPVWYGQFGWTEAPISKEDGYVWPGACPLSE